MTAIFLLHRKLRPMQQKTLRVDRTAAYNIDVASDRRRRRILQAGFFFIYLR